MEKSLPVTIWFAAKGNIPTEEELMFAILKPSPVPTFTGKGDVDVVVMTRYRLAPPFRLFIKPMLNLFPRVKAALSESIKYAYRPQLTLVPIKQYTSNKKIS